MWPRRITDVEEPPERWCRGHKESRNSSTGGIRSNQGNSPTGRKENPHNACPVRFHNCYRPMIAVCPPSGLLLEGSFCHNYPLLDLQWYSGSVRGLSEDSMSISSSVVRSHRGTSRSKEVCASSALDFELDAVTWWDFGFSSFGRWQLVQCGKESVPNIW